MTKGKMTRETLEVRSDKRKPRMLLRHRTSQNIIEHHRTPKNIIEYQRTSKNIIEYHTTEWAFWSLNLFKHLVFFELISEWRGEAILKERKKVANLRKLTDIYKKSKTGNFEMGEGKQFALFPEINQFW